MSMEAAMQLAEALDAIRQSVNFLGIIISVNGGLIIATMIWAKTKETK
jgi:ABC-type transport system involved in cytochrome c biogenesis permease subunit